MRKTFVLVIVLTLNSQISFAQRLGGDVSGGGNNVEAVLANASRLLLLATEQKTTGAKLKKDNQEIYKNYKSRIVNELTAINFDFDHISTEPFMHNGAPTWIETPLIPFGVIRVRSKVMEEMIGKITVNVAASYIAHEIGHHIFGDHEQKSWDLSNMLSDVFMTTVKFPYFLNLSTHYTGTVPGCRDIAHVEGDPFTGILSVTAKSTGHCTVSSTYHSTFDTVSFTFNCKDKGGRVYCKPDRACMKNRRDEDNGLYAEVFFDGNLVVFYNFYDRSYGYQINNGYHTILQKYVAN